MSEQTYTLYCGDCLDYMRGMDASGVDAVITDPQYGNGTDYGSTIDTPEFVEDLIRRFMPEALRVARRVVVTCGVPNMWIYPRPTWVLNWTDPSGEGGCQWGFPSWQPILVYGKDPYLQNGLGRRSDTIVKRFLRQDVKHPCSKPLDFIKWLVNRTCMRGDTVFDPFMGSGTTGVACMQLGRNFIGCEIDPAYYAIAERRIKDAAAQPALFTLDAPAPKYEQAALMEL